MKRDMLAMALATALIPASPRAQVDADPAGPNDGRQASVDRRLASIRASVDRIKAMPNEEAGALVLLDEEKPADVRSALVSRRTAAAWEVGRLQWLISERAGKLEARLADARREVARIQSEERNAPGEIMNLVKAMEAGAKERAALIQHEIDDNREDAHYVEIPDPSAAERQGLIDRKLALLNHAAAYLEMEKKFLMDGQTPG